MSRTAWRSVAIVLGVLVIALLASSGWLLWSNVWLSLTAHFAEEQTRIFQEMSDQALATDNAHRAANCLDYIVSYYPSGTKQERGTPLDFVVERHRNNSANAVIRRLRELTGKDLGDAPKPWITEYSEHPLRQQQNR